MDLKIHISPLCSLYFTQLIRSLGQHVLDFLFLMCNCFSYAVVYDYNLYGGLLFCSNYVTVFNRKCQETSILDFEQGIKVFP